MTVIEFPAPNLPDLGGVTGDPFADLLNSTHQERTKRLREYGDALIRDSRPYTDDEIANYWTDYPYTPSGPVAETGGDEREAIARYLMARATERLRSDVAYGGPDDLPQRLRKRWVAQELAYLVLELQRGDHLIRK